jgi:hypothetical protein
LGDVVDFDYLYLIWIDGHELGITIDRQYELQADARAIMQFSLRWLCNWFDWLHWFGYLTGWDRLDGRAPGRSARAATARAPRAFSPPEIVMEVKALACQLPRDLCFPFSRLTRGEIARQAVNRGITASISGATVWRWLNQDAIRPWCYRSWIWLRDPEFEPKAGKILDL